MAEYLLSMAEAFSRFMPDVSDIASRTMAFSGLDKFKAGVVEGDLVIDREGLVLTSEMVPAFNDAMVAKGYVRIMTVREVEKPPAEKAEEEDEDAGD